MLVSPFSNREGKKTNHEWQGVEVLVEGIGLAFDSPQRRRLMPW